MIGTSSGWAPRAGGASPTKRGAGVVLSLPDPDGTFQRFVVHRSRVMAPGLAAKHPEIQTYSGVGIDDPAATIRADLSPVGFHASVRSAGGRVVHRSVLPPRPERLLELLRGKRVGRVALTRGGAYPRVVTKPQLGTAYRVTFPGPNVGTTYAPDASMVVDAPASSAPAAERPRGTV